jgi:hypothetical protein
VRYRSRRPDAAAVRLRLHELTSGRRQFGYRRLHIERKPTARNSEPVINSHNWSIVLQKRNPGAVIPLSFSHITGVDIFQKLFFQKRQHTKRLAIISGNKPGR